MGGLSGSWCGKGVGGRLYCIAFYTFWILNRVAILSIKKVNVYFKIAA